MKYSNLDLGTIEAVVNKLGGMEGVQRFLRGEISVTGIEHLIDCDSAPFVPEGWFVEEHKPGGQFSFDPAGIELYLSKKQKNGVIIGNDLRKELADKKVLNACVLDFLLAHPELIPDSWKRKAVFFFGTIFRDSYGNPCVRCLSWDGSEWYWRCSWLDYDFYSDNPVAIAS